MLEKRKELLAQVKDIQQKIDKKETKERQFHEKIAEMTAAIQAQVSELQKYQDQHDKVQQTKRGKVTELEEKKLKEVSIKKKIASREHDNCTIKAEMDDYERKKVELEEKKQEARRRRNEIEQKRGHIEAAKRTLAQDKTNAENAVEQAATVIHQKKQKMQKLNVVINQKEEHLRRVQCKQTNTLTQYGPWMQQLVDAIKEGFRRKKFSKMPRGPLGAYIKMKDPNLAALAEYALGYGILKKFVVDTWQDEKELKQIMDRVIPSNVARLPIMCVKFVEEPVYGIREAEYNNVFSNLEIDDPVVSNILIELTNCQGTILIEDNNTALALLSNPHNVPANTVIGYTPDGSKHYPVSGRGLYKTYNGKLNSKVPRFVQTEQTTLIRELTNEIKQLKSELASMQQDIRADEKELMRCQQHERDVANQLHHLVSKLKKLQDDLNRSVVDEESKLAPLDLYKEEYSYNLRDIEKCETELKQNREEQKVIKTSIKQLDEELAELAPNLESDEVTKMGAVEANLVRFKLDTETWQSKLKEAQTKVEHLTKRLEDQSAMVELHTKEAEQLAARELYLNPRVMSEVEEELIEVQNLLERAEEMGGGNPLELEAAISERLEEYERGIVECKVADCTIGTVKNHLSNLKYKNVCNISEPANV